MTWDQLIKKVREGLSESGARIQMLGPLLVRVNEDGTVLGEGGTRMALTMLALVVSDLHSTIEHLTIGLDAVVETLRQADKSQGVKGE